MQFLALPEIQRVLMFIPIFILCLSIHEYAHAWMAQKLGDPTAKYLGRLTIDPMAHISIMGTIIFPAIGLLTGGFLFGWANPVPIDPRYFKKPRQGMAMVAAAGPGINIVMAIFLALGLGILARFIPLDAFFAKTGVWQALYRMVEMAIQLNLFLAFFNLLPIPPLDGSRILAGIVGEKLARDIDAIESMGFWILLALMLTGTLRFLAHWVIAAEESLLSFFLLGSLPPTL